MQDETMVVLAEYNTITEAEIKTAPPVLRQAGCRRQRRAVRNGAYRHRVREGHASKRVYVQVARTPFSILRGTQSGAARVR